MSNRPGSIEIFLSSIRELKKKTDKITIKKLSEFEKNKLLYYYHIFDSGRYKRVSVNLNDNDRLETVNLEKINKELEELKSRLDEYDRLEALKTPYPKTFTSPCKTCSQPIWIYGKWTCPECGNEYDNTVQYNVDLGIEISEVVTGYEVDDNGINI